MKFYFLSTCICIWNYLWQKKRLLPGYFWSCNFLGFLYQSLQVANKSDKINSYNTIFHWNFIQYLIKWNMITELHSGNCHIAEFEDKLENNGRCMTRLTMSDLLCLQVYWWPAIAYCSIRLQWIKQQTLLNSMHWKIY